jgi:alkanesulfonate monooxygenase SsuD/methylene tetrahydromethanopterin reductase-like flavin-dependent oxidoreductase (luciferase family)
MVSSPRLGPHLTRGGAAWNVVTSLNHNQSANYGEERRPTDERYDRAHEFIEVCRKLWAMTLDKHMLAEALRKQG